MAVSTAVLIFVRHRLHFLRAVVIGGKLLVLATGAGSSLARDYLPGWSCHRLESPAARRGTAIGTDLPVMSYLPRYKCYYILSQVLSDKVGCSRIHVEKCTLKVIGFNNPKTIQTN